MVIYYSVKLFFYKLHSFARNCFGILTEKIYEC